MRTVKQKYYFLGENGDEKNEVDGCYHGFGRLAGFC